LPAGIHTVTFIGLNPNGGDNTAFIDQVAISSPPSGSIVLVAHIIPGHGKSGGHRSDAGNANASVFAAWIREQEEQEGKSKGRHQSEETRQSSDGRSQ
jgi:hypothetical protein